MAEITEIIPKQNFELVAEAIVAILGDEIANQKTLQPANLPENVSVFKERIVAVDKTEEVVVNVLLDQMASTYKTESDMQGLTNYFIDIYSHGKQTSGELGDKVSSDKLLKYVGIVRYILQSHKYVTLGLPLGTIGGKRVDNIQIYEQESTPDTNFARMARINFAVRIMESQDIWAGVLAAQNITQSKLELTELGYQYKLNE